MALATGTPIVPMAIFGTGGLRLRDWRPWRRPDVRIVLGAPLPADPGRTPEEISDAFMRTLASMLGQAYLPGPPDRADAPLPAQSRQNVVTSAMPMGAGSS
jgi:1-acyl-sn-glycerol-3-phosphate acyltransferase